MNAPTAEELIAFAKEALPLWFFEEDRTEEEMFAFSGIIEDGIDIADFWRSQTLITTAVGPTGTEPDWLNQHAIDRGTFRQGGETDEALRARIRNVPDALTRQALLDAVQLILDEEGIGGTPEMVELRRDKAYFGDFTGESGTGGTFTAGSGDFFRFEPTAGYARPPYLGVFPHYGYKLVISGAAQTGNNGSFVTTGVVGDSAEYINASGVAGFDGSVSWQLQKLDPDGNGSDGYSRAYMSRGYRMGGIRLNSIIVILPYGCTSGTEASVREMLRQRKGGGIVVHVERRTSP